MRRHWKRFKLGDERTREFFSWWPVTVRHEHAAETRWLETVRVLERWTEFKFGERFWPQRFVDESNSNSGECTPPTLDVRGNAHNDTQRVTSGLLHRLVLFFWRRLRQGALKGD